MQQNFGDDSGKGGVAAIPAIFGARAALQEVLVTLEVRAALQQFQQILEPRAALRQSFGDVSGKGVVAVIPAIFGAREALQKNFEDVSGKGVFPAILETRASSEAF